MCHRRQHLCVNSRGINDIASSTVTAKFVEDLKKRVKKESFDFIKWKLNSNVNN